MNHLTSMWQSLFIKAQFRNHFLDKPLYCLSLPPYHTAKHLFSMVSLRIYTIYHNAFYILHCISVIGTWSPFLKGVYRFIIVCLEYLVNAYFWANTYCVSKIACISYFRLIQDFKWGKYSMEDLKKHTVKTSLKCNT